jgi:hypothetical protein
MGLRGQCGQQSVQTALRLPRLKKDGNAELLLAETSLVPGTPHLFNILPNNRLLT